MESTDVAISSNSDIIKLTPLSKTLIKAFSDSSNLERPPSDETLDVSETVTFFAFIYEKMRNAVEFGEEHLVRRSAITRILRRRLSVNPKSFGEGENLLRELLWGRYLEQGSATMKDARVVQKIIQTYLLLLQTITNKSTLQKTPKLKEYIIDLASCEIEEYLNPSLTQKRLSMLYFLYHATRDKVHIEGVKTDIKDKYYYVACEQAYLKNDYAFVRYHIFTINNGPLYGLDKDKIEQIADEFKQTIQNIESILKNSYNERLFRYVRSQLPPYRILYQILSDYQPHTSKILTNSIELKTKVDEICEKKYGETGNKLRSAGIRSIIYIFLTKMILALVLEIPLSQLIYNEIQLLSITINTIFPPFLMALIVGFVSPPRKDNTHMIYRHIVSTLTFESKNEQRPQLEILKKKKVRRPILLSIFTIVYTTVFVLTFWFIYIILKQLGFNAISIVIFVFFLSLVAFFGFRVRQISREYVLSKSSGIFSPVIDTFFLPILSTGKIFSRELAKINIFMYIFDVLIEAPFKVIIDVVEEWVSFTRARKDEIL